MTIKQNADARQARLVIDLPPSTTTQAPMTTFYGEQATVRLYRSVGVGFTASIAPIIDGKRAGGRSFIGRDLDHLTDQARTYAPDGTMGDLTQCLEKYRGRAGQKEHTP